MIDWMPDWLEIWIGMIFLFILNGRLHIWGHKQRQKRNHQKFMRAVRVEYPDTYLTFVAIESSDEAAMADLERQFRENRYVRPGSDFEK